MMLTTCHMFVIMFAVVYLPWITAQKDPENVELIPLENFKPNPERCISEYTVFKKYLDRENAEKKTSAIPESKIKASIDGFYHKHGKSSKGDKLAEFVGQSGGEFASWMAALVQNSFALLDVSLVAINALSIVSPGVGLISFAFGIYNKVQEKKAKKELLKDIQKNFMLLNTKMNLQFEELKEYVDDSIINSDNQRLEGDMSQLQLHLSDCLMLNDEANKQYCLYDSCSNIKASFKKFALSEEKLGVKLPTALTDWIDHESKTVTSDFDIKKIIGIKNSDGTKLAIGSGLELLESMSVQEIERIFANIKVFHSYVATLLLPCEMQRVISEMFTNSTVIAPPDHFVDLDANANEWSVKDRVTTYLDNSLFVIFVGHLTSASLKQHGYTKDYERRTSGVGGRHYRNVQCRFQMNEFFKDFCDREYQTDKDRLTLAEAEARCNEEIMDEKASFDRTVKYDRMKEYLKIDEMKKMLDTLYAGPTSITTTRDVMVENGNNLISDDSQQTSPGENNASPIVNAFSRRHGIHSKTKKRHG